MIRSIPEWVDGWPVEMKLAWSASFILLAILHMFRVF